VAEAPRRRRLAVYLAGAAFAVVGGRQVGEIPLDAGGELVGLVIAVVPDEAQVLLPPGTLTTPTRIDAETLTQPWPLGPRDQNDCDREQGDVQPAHAASLAQRHCPRSHPDSSARTFSRR